MVWSVLVKTSKFWGLILAGLMIGTIATTNNITTIPKSSLAQTHYAGQRLSLNFQDIKVRAVLQLLAEFTGMNIVVSDTVQGSITLHLENVPWNQALEIILQSQGLGKRQIDNVLLIAPIKDMAAHDKQELQAEQQILDLAPLHSELIQINYGKAADIANLLQNNKNSTGGTTLLSSRGSVSVDARTNTIWVQDTSVKVAEIRKLITQLDIPVRQVLIAARIVNINSSYEKELGVRFGVSKSSHLSGTLEGGTAIAGNVPPSSIPIAQRLNVDLPAAGVGTPGGASSVGIALARLGRGTLLDLELSAMESEGSGQIISNPRVVTADQQQALIESGEEIPYQQATSSGATNVTFQKAVLSLNVTPQITPDGKIMLNLKINQDQVGTRAVHGVPSILTRQIETQVLVDNCETIVLGGIYQQTSNNAIKRVPFLGTLPIIGTLFRNNDVRETKQELLVFITPQIVQPYA